MNIQKIGRDPKVEFWRCACMLAVVIQHVLYNNNICGMEMFRWHIPGFLIITGYFGVSFRLSKIIKLILIAYLCYWITLPFHDGGSSWISLILPHGGWFLPFYCVLIVLSPVLNAALRRSEDLLGILISIVVLVFIAWVPTFSNNPHVGMIRVPGMQGEGLLLMIALYVAGAVVRRYRIENGCHSPVWAIFFVSGICCCYIIGKISPSASHYASPISILTAVSGFCMCKTLPPMGEIVGKVVNFIGPSMFSVYLIHECCIKKYQYLSAGCGVVDALIRAFVLFGICIVIDMLRRGIMLYMGKMVERFGVMEYYINFSRRFDNLIK